MLLAGATNALFRYALTGKYMHWFIKLRKIEKQRVLFCFFFFFAKSKPFGYYTRHVYNKGICVETHKTGEFESQQIC